MSKATALSLIPIVALAAQVSYASLILTEITEPESSATFPANTSILVFPSMFTVTSQTADPLGPFSGESVSFEGFAQPGGSQELLPGSTTQFLIYRFELMFNQPVDISSIAVTGVAFNDDVLRLLDSNRNVLDSVTSFAGNNFATLTLNTPGVTGRTFFLDEFDLSSFFRYRSDIVVNATAVPEPATLWMLLGVIALIVLMRVRANRVVRPGSFVGH
jgi:hypothetical protein